MSSDLKELDKLVSRINATKLDAAKVQAQLDLAKKAADDLIVELAKMGYKIKKSLDAHKIRTEIEKEFQELKTECEEFLQDVDDTAREITDKTR